MNRTLLATGAPPPRRGPTVPALQLPSSNARSVVEIRSPRAASAPFSCAAPRCSYPPCTSSACTTHRASGRGVVGDGAGRGQTSGPKLQGGREYSGALHKAKLALASEEAGLVRAPALFANGLNRLAGDLRLHARRLHCHLCTSRHLQCQPAEAAGHDNIQRGRRILHGRCRRAIRVQQQGKARARPEGRWCARGPVEQQRFDVDGPVSARSVRDRAESSERSSREAGGAAPQQVGAPSSQRQHACGQRCKKRNLPLGT